MAYLEKALSVLFCLIDDAYRLLNPRAERYEALKRVSDSEVIALALFQQLRGAESCRSFLRDAVSFFSHMFPGVVGLHPSSLHRRMRKLRGYLEPLRREILPELVGYAGRRSGRLLGRGGYPSGDRAILAAARSEAAHRDRFLQLEEGFRSRRDVSFHAGGPCDSDRGQKRCLHLRVLG